MQKQIPSNAYVDVKNKIKQETDAQKTLEKCKARERKLKLQPYTASDGKTTFNCSTPEKGKAAIERYERKLRKYIGI